MYMEQHPRIKYLVYGRWLLRQCTGRPKKNAANFQLKKAWFFFRSIFLKFCRRGIWSIESALKRTIVTHYIYYRGTARRHLIEKRDLLFYYNALGGLLDQGCQNAYNSGLPSAASFLLYIYKVGYHRYLHAKFEEDLPKKKPSFFQLKICCIVSGSDCTVYQIGKISKSTIEILFDHCR